MMIVKLSINNNSKDHSSFLFLCFVTKNKHGSEVTKYTFLGVFHSYKKTQSVSFFSLNEHKFSFFCSDLFKFFSGGSVN